MIHSSNVNKFFKKRWQWISIVLALTVIHNEYYVFWQDSWTWPRLDCRNNDNSSCQTILVVSDPQILRRSKEPVGFLGYIDSDTYLKRSFHTAVKHLLPDVIIFMGDAMDEGSQVDRKEYSQYKERFDSIFDTPEFKPLVINIPGDNDIGGEGSDRNTKEKIQRFNYHFGSETQILNKNVNYLLVNRIIPDLNFPNISLSQNQFRVVLSHIPLTFFQGIFSEAVVKHFKPHLIFSAHDHRLAMVTTQYVPYRFTFQASEIEDMKRSLKIQKHLNDAECVEIVWPTCSYRMGEPDVGYGAVTISSDGRMEAGVLWVHSRFTMLTIYVWVLILCFVFYICSTFRINYLRHIQL